MYVIEIASDMSPQIKGTPTPQTARKLYVKHNKEGAFVL